jgi:RNA polymerase sigma-70 factor (ECF subfamily)
MECEAELQRLWASAYAAARRTWPAIRYEQQQFEQWLAAQRIEPRALSSHGEDLFLAAACAAGSAEAIAVFENVYVREMRPLVGRVRLTPEMADELRQILRVRLLTGPSPKIARYRGSGPLGGWLRVVATRIALELRESTDRRTSSDSVVMDALASTGTSPELTAAKLQHQQLFRAELERSFRELAVREKTLLRLHFLHGMSIDEMGAVLRVHRATVARWLVALRRRIFEQLRTRLALQIHSGSAVNSLIRLVWDDVELSVARLLDDAENDSQD